VSSSTIRVGNVSKWFGPVVAVNGVSFEVGPGITGLLGPNGAGKTTLLRMVAGLIKPSEGSVEVLGSRVRNDRETLSRIGVLPEHDGVYGFMTGREFVVLNGRLSGVADVEAATRRALEAVQLVDAQDRPLAGYSRGMRQRMRLAAALVHDPLLLLLDEPLSGADPRQRLHFMEITRRLAAEGRTIVISSHVLEDVEALAERILLMVGGKLAAAGDYRAIRRKLNERPFHVRLVCSDARRMASALMETPRVDAVTVDAETSLRVLSRDVEALQRAVPLIARRTGIRLMRVEPLDDTLESVFSYLAER
jgi:ABC-2 type transport system ATP-binding protein